MRVLCFVLLVAVVLLAFGGPMLVLAIVALVGLFGLGELVAGRGGGTISRRQEVVRRQLGPQPPPTDLTVAQYDDERWTREWVRRIKGKR